MHPKQRACLHQQQRVRRCAADSDSYAFFNLLTGPELLEPVEALLPEHRERLFPPTETLSMFLAQAMSAVRDLPILTVTDEVEGVANMGIINLVTSSGKVRFQVDARKARRLGFKISSQLLQLALSVYE